MNFMIKSRVSLAVAIATLICASSCSKEDDPNTEPDTPTIGQTSQVAVDLGLSIKWASMNVGASTPGDFGSYFAWGETKSKNTYTESNSQWENVSYSKLKSKGVIDGNGNLNSKYDAACANWGGDWRMPTVEECDELLEKCTWTWDTQDGHDGYRVTGPNGNSIFMPAAGYIDGSDKLFAGNGCCYWSATVSDSETGQGWYMYYVERQEEYSTACTDVYQGQSVRPVCK